MQARPFCKWVGGKNQLLPELLKHFPEVIDTYFEPFLGGGAVFFTLAAEKRFQRALLNDWNAELVNAYVSVMNSPADLMAVLLTIEEEYKESPEKVYYKWRAEDPKTLLPLAAAARFIFLNKAGFNGLYRVNSKGGFNTPWGKREKVTTFDAENILACSAALLKNVTLNQGDFADVLSFAKEVDFVYLDPPYVPVTLTANFTSYTSVGFGLKEQERLAGVFKKLSEKGVKVVLSNSDTQVVRDLYAGFTIHSVQARRAVNSKGSSRGPVGEVIVVG
jgi:DNA adenine methylase